jgi:hypothetical protein
LTSSWLDLVSSSALNAATSSGSMTENKRSSSEKFEDKIGAGKFKEFA